MHGLRCVECESLASATGQAPVQISAYHTYPHWSLTTYSAHAIFVVFWSSVHRTVRRYCCST